MYYTEDDYIQTYKDSENYNDYQEKIGSQGLDHNLANTIAELLEALELTPKPSKKLTTPAITENEIKEFRKYFKSKTYITASDLATMLLTIYSYSKDIKDNRNLAKISTDLLTLLRLVKFYDNNRNATK